MLNINNLAQFPFDCRPAQGERDAILKGRDAATALCMRAREVILLCASATVTVSSFLVSRCCLILLKPSMHAVFRPRPAWPVHFSKTIAVASKQQGVQRWWKARNVAKNGRPGGMCVGACRFIDTNKCCLEEGHATATTFDETKLTRIGRC